jgi:hypothetical protein
MRRKKKLRSTREGQRPVVSSFPGTGPPPDPRISFPRHDSPSPGKTSFSKATNDQIREELRFQEERLRSLRQTFPRVTTGTTAELNEAEERAASKIDAHQHLIQTLKLELLSRGENPAVALSEYPGAASEQAAEFQHSADFRSVTLRGRAYSLTSRQAQVIQILDEALANGHPDVAHAFILEELRKPFKYRLLARNNTL